MQTYLRHGFAFSPISVNNGIRYGVVRLSNLPSVLEPGEVLPLDQNRTHNVTMPPYVLLQQRKSVMLTSLTWIYVIATLTLAIYGCNMLLLLGLSIWSWRRPLSNAAPPDAWPMILVQLPIFNERYMVRRLLDAVADLDYPTDRLLIQVLDDSTDETSRILQTHIAHHRDRGIPITYLHRHDRMGFKAGALAAGLAATEAEFVAIFDADFVPPRNFLKRIIPQFCATPRLGFVQTRWEHLNADQSMLTRVIALALDCFFVVDQTARSRAGLMSNFNGSAGVWRCAAIEEAGGWQGDTITEDLDLSYRAQMLGWQFGYLPEVGVPADVPNSIMALKNQQFRWAKGSFQVLRKLARQILSNPTSRWRKLQAFLHLSGYLCHPLLIIVLLFTLPVVLLHGYTPVPLALLGLGGLVGLVPMLGGIFSQIVLQRNWLRHLLYIPLMMLMGIGMAASNTYALWDSFFGRRNEFIRTPKPPRQRSQHHAYAVMMNGTTWSELLLALYALVVTLLAIERAPTFAPFIFLYVLGFGSIAMLTLWQNYEIQQTRYVRQTSSE